MRLLLLLKSLNILLKYKAAITQKCLNVTEVKSTLQKSLIDFVKMEWKDSSQLDTLHIKMAFPKVRILCDGMAKSMLHEKKIPSSFWADAVYTTDYLISRSPTKALVNQTPMKLGGGENHLLSILKYLVMCYKLKFPMREDHA